MKRIAIIRANSLHVNLIALAIAIVLYYFIYRGLWNIQTPFWVGGAGLVLLVILVIVLLFAHEAIHMLAANLFSKNARASLKIRILTWECRLKGPLTRQQYIAYALAPGIVLGLLGAVCHSAFVSPDYKFLSAIIFVVGLSGAGGDFWFVAKVLRFPRESLVMDHGLEMEIISIDEV